MTTKQVTVTKYVSCSGVEFDNPVECESYECNLRRELHGDRYNLRKRINELKEEINECRIKARLARLDALKLKRECVITAMDRSRFCKLMADHFCHVSEYNQKRRKLSEARHALSMITDNLYMWYGEYARKSSVARLERKRKSDMWKREHTPDKWTTPHKIRVSKQPAKECE